MDTPIIYLKNKKYGEVLQKLIRDRKVEKLAEIGVFKGKTMKNILKSDCRDIIKDYIAVDPYKRLRIPSPKEKGRVLTTKDCEWDGMYKNVCRCFAYFSQLRIVKLSSAEAAELFPNSYFDLVFIDADHIYEEFKRDTELWIPKVKNNGILCGHDFGNRYPDIERVAVEKFGTAEALSDDIKWDKLGDKLRITYDTMWIKEINRCQT